jgi:predicted enzyme related to lactoylglutathione lyase
MNISKKLLIFLCVFPFGGAVASSKHVNNSIDYIEFTVTNLVKAKTFYGEAFGWKFNDYGPSYAGIQKDGGEAGGLREDTKVISGGPLVILYSNDLEGCLKKITASGGGNQKATV